MISYTFRYLNFKIQKNNKKYGFSRVSYIDAIIRYIPLKKLKKQMLLEKKQRILEKKQKLLEKKKKKRNFSRNEYVKKKIK